MSQSIGQKLAAARKRRDLTIEDIAHETRIHIDTIRNLEADDYSRFANFTYARSFLSMYGQHLGIEMTDYLKEFRSAHNGGAETHESYETNTNGNTSPEVFVDGDSLQSLRPMIVLVAVFAIICAIPAMYFLGRTHGFKSANKIAAENARAAAQSQPEFQPPLPPPALEPRNVTPTIPEPAAQPVAAPPALEPPRNLADLRAPIETTPNPDAEPPTPATADPGDPVEVRRPAILIEKPTPAEAAEPVIRSAQPLE